jgi:hypothetical protein
LITQDFVEYYFKEFVFGFMYNDIRRTIDLAKANFLAALGLSVYTEVMGGLVTGHLRNAHSSRKNYEAFLPFLGKDYVALHKQIDLYERVRCGLVHQYFVKGRAMIAVKSIRRSASGIVYTSKFDHICIYLERYFEDFKNGVQRYHSILLSGDTEALQKFAQAVVI